MKTATLLLTALVMSTAFLAAAPAADARQACVYDGRSDPCDDKLVCVWNRLTAQWDCYVDVGCLFRCWVLP